MTSRTVRVSRRRAPVGQQGRSRSARLALDGPGTSAAIYLAYSSSMGGSAAIRLRRRCGDTSCADHSRKHPDACISANASASEPTDRGTPIRTPGRLSACIAMPVDSPRRGASDGTERQTSRPAPVPQLPRAVKERMPNPVRFGLYLVLASTPLLTMSVRYLVSSRCARLAPCSFSPCSESPLS